MHQFQLQEGIYLDHSAFFTRYQDACRQLLDIYGCAICWWFFYKIKTNLLAHGSGLDFIEHILQTPADYADSYCTVVLEKIPNKPVISAKEYGRDYTIRRHKKVQANPFESDHGSEEPERVEEEAEEAIVEQSVECEEEAPDVVAELH
ncbi:hypothetical protein ACROYT_G013232 [Oculina patagonica]